MGVVADFLQCAQLEHTRQVFLRESAEAPSSREELLQTVLPRLPHLSAPVDEGDRDGGSGGRLASDSAASAPNEARVDGGANRMPASFAASEFPPGRPVLEEVLFAVKQASAGAGHRSGPS